MSFKVGDRVRLTEGQAETHAGALGIVLEEGENPWVHIYQGKSPNNCSRKAYGVNCSHAHGAGIGWDDCFNTDFLELVTNQSKENKPMGRRTFKLVKAMPGIKVGTLFQEECEDGTQPYSPMDGQPSEVNISFRDRSLVEDSKFFEEVWKVEPQFMTRAELDRFEAFKKLPKGKKPAKVAKTKKTAKKGYKKLTAAQKSKTLVAARKGYSKNGKRLGRPPKAGK